MIDNVFELNDPVMRPGVNDVTVDGVSVVHSGNVAEIPAIDNVTQTNTTADAEHRVLLSNSANSTTETAGVDKSNGLLYNPSAKQLIVRNPNYSTYMTMTEPNIGIYQKSNPNSYWGGMRITARDITLEGKVSDTSSVNQTWDGANTSLKSAISSVVLSGTSEPTSSVGRENSLYVKYKGGEVIIPTTELASGSPAVEWDELLNYNSIRVVIDSINGTRRYDDIVDISSEGMVVLKDRAEIIIGSFGIQHNPIDAIQYAANIDQKIKIYDATPKSIDDIYFKNDDAWIKDNYKDTVSTDITNLETSISNLEDSIDSQFRTQTSGTYTEGGTMIAGAIAEDTVAIEPMSGYTPIGILESSATSSNNNVQLMIFNAHKVTEGIAYKLMNVGQAFSNQNFTVEFKVLYKKNNS